MTDVFSGEAERQPKGPGWVRLTEFALMLVVAAGCAHIVYFFFRWGYLPQPFVYSTDATFYDWFDTAFWAHNPDPYRAWGTVYPPLSFVFLRILSIASCYEPPSYEAGLARSCDWLGTGSILTFWLLNILVVYRSFRRFDLTTSISRTVAVAIGLPMLFALERGNLCLPCFLFFALGHGRSLRQASLRWLSVAMSINFKPYLLFAALPLAARRRWRWLEGCGLATLLVYVATYALEGSGNPLELIENQRNWSEFVRPQYWWNIYSTTSFTPFINALDAPFPVLDFIDSRTLEAAVFAATLFIRLGAVGVGAAMVAAFLRPAAAPTYRLAALGFSVILTTSNPGGYATMFLLFLVFLERPTGAMVMTALACAYLLSVPWDYIVQPLFGRDQSSWLSGRQVATIFGISIGQFLRPALILLIQYTLVIATVNGAIRAAPRMRRAPDLSPKLVQLN